MRKTTKSKGMLTCRKNLQYTKEEADVLLEIVGGITPIGSMEWDVVAEKYGNQFPIPPRDTESLRHKFNSIKNKTMPTGDPRCPSPVVRAKKIEKAMLKRGQGKSMTKTVLHRQR